MDVGKQNDDEIDYYKARKLEEDEVLQTYGQEAAASQQQEKGVVSISINEVVSFRESLSTLKIGDSERTNAL